MPYIWKTNRNGRDERFYVSDQNAKYATSQNGETVQVGGHNRNQFKGWVSTSHDQARTPPVLSGAQGDAGMEGLGWLVYGLLCIGAGYAVHLGVYWLVGRGFDVGRAHGWVTLASAISAGPYVDKVSWVLGVAVAVGAWLARMHIRQVIFSVIAVVAGFIAYGALLNALKPVNIVVSYQVGAIFGVVYFLFIAPLIVRKVYGKPLNPFKRKAAGITK